MNDHPDQSARQSRRTSGPTLRTAMAVVIFISVAVVVVVWKRGGDEPVGQIVAARFFINPRQFAEGYHSDTSLSVELPDRLFIVSLDAALAGKRAEDLFRIRHSGKGIFRPWWTFPYVEIVTDRGVYLLRLGRESVEEVLGPGNEDGRIRFLYHCERTGFFPRLSSPILSRAIVRGVLADPELHPHLRTLMLIAEIEAKAASK